MRQSLVPSALSRVALIAALGLGPALPALAQNQPAPGTTSAPAPTPNAPAATATDASANTGGQKGRVDCPPSASQAAPATPQGNPPDATAPANPASTGWSGGLGGSYEGTNPAGATAHTKTWHPPTARGVDLKGRPDPAPPC